MGVVFLVIVGVTILLAGVIWVIGAVPGLWHSPASRAGGATSSASPMPAAERAQYQVSRVRVAARWRGTRVRWSAPSRTVGVTAFIVVAELGGRAQQEHTVGPAGRRAIFAGLQPRHRYCFVVGTVVESGAGQAGTATAPRVCKVTP